MSAGIQGPEQIIDAFVARCQPAALNAQIAVVNADAPAPADDTYLLEDFADGSVDNFIPPPSALMTFPFLGCRRAGGNLEDDNAWSATGVWRVGLMIYYAHSDPATLQRRLTRYLQAVSRVALAGRHIGDRPWGIRVVGFNFGPPMVEVQGRDDYISWVEILVEAKHDEE